MKFQFAFLSVAFLAACVIETTYGFANTKIVVDTSPRTRIDTSSPTTTSQLNMVMELSTLITAAADMATNAADIAASVSVTSSAFLTAAADAASSFGIDSSQITTAFADYQDVVIPASLFTTSAASTMKFGSSGSSTTATAPTEEEEAKVVVAEEEVLPPPVVAVEAVVAAATSSVVVEEEVVVAEEQQLVVAVVEEEESGEAVVASAVVEEHVVEELVVVEATVEEEEVVVVEEKHRPLMDLYRPTKLAAKKAIEKIRNFGSKLSTQTVMKHRPMMELRMVSNKIGEMVDNTIDEESENESSSRYTNYMAY